MNKTSYDLLTNVRNSLGHNILIGKVMVVIMMMIIAIGVVLLGERIVPGWRGGYLVWASLVIAIEAMVTRDHARELEGRERIIFHLSEWVAIAVALKMFIYLIRGPAQLLQDLPLWQANFLENFFNGEYILALFIAGLVWVNSLGYASDLESLYERDMDTRWDELGKLQNALHDVRQRISTRIFIIGSLVVLMAALSRVDATTLFRSIGKPPPGYYAPVVNVLAYFIIALILLSQTQFALLRIRWLWQKMPISPNLAKNWLRYSLFFFLFLAILVFFLPTEYSIGLFDVLRYAVNLLLRAASILMMLIALPFTLCLSLFKLSGTQGAPQPEQPSMPLLIGGPSQPPIAWLEFLRSLAFWIIFLAVIFFALRFYLSQNAVLWKAITGFPLFRWVNKAWDGFWKWLRGANRQLAALVQTGIQRMRAQRMASPAQTIRRMFNFNRLNPREKIIFFYLNLVAMGGQQGLERKPSQTPYQYEDRLREAIPEVDQELHGLTGTFIEARYSRHPVEQPNAEQASSLWARIKEVLKNWKRER